MVLLFFLFPFLKIRSNEIAMMVDSNPKYEKYDCVVSEWFVFWITNSYIYIYYFLFFLSMYSCFLILPSFSVQVALIFLFGL